METRVNYAIVGIFVVALSIALVGVGLWLGADISAKEYHRYSIYTEESVAGLTSKAAVRYRGVTVGYVDSIELAPNNPEQVHVVVAIEDGTPIKTDTKAKLDIQGLTGLAAIELTGGTRQASQLAASPGEPYPIIESEPSLITRVDSALTQGLQILNRLADQVSKVLSDENIATIHSTLANLEAVSTLLTENSAHIRNTLHNAEQLSAAGTTAANALPGLLRQAEQTLGRFDALAADLQTASGQFGQLSSDGQEGLHQLNRVTLPQLNSLLVEMQRLGENLTRLSEEFNENPQMLIFGRPHSPSGPGER
jgi:phospholipid/cholesterol/gamma-HCH transport system substrate-binding protein